MRTVLAAKLLLPWVWGLVWALPASAANPAPSAATGSDAACPAILQHTFARLQDEKPQSLCQYKGKVLLVVNTASYCGFTGQYKGLEGLHARYKDQGLVVLGFPSNDFSQETGNNQQIADFCENTFGVKFPMFAKSSVSGAQASPFYKQLAQMSGQTPRWNFYKYVINRKGELVGSYSSMTGPDDKALLKTLQRELAAP
ncbi:glutathione peroxidase [Curvibacter sp. RS43]|jgi:glutathione peroxidase|uniref:Glutathione peroxidase n=1 Tax=Curvibacter microcysteis TaxID=3026419 RepID=A0ABT5MHV5_9BURK|nr:MULTISPECIES: glutathione peroxidase [unclassified Curvibacter]MDD0810911.1 glutathione peroxidase [Curvibacter sp. RS43]MDD0816133.1 glutathione peroxidase [Curvibacter sp. HBC28]